MEGTWLHEAREGGRAQPYRVLKATDGVGSQARCERKFYVALSQRVT